MCFEPIEFYTSPGVSFGGTEVHTQAGRPALIFTNRPLARGENITLKIHGGAIRSIVRIGFCEPKTLEGNLPKMLPYGLDEGTGIRGPACGDGGWVKGDATYSILFEQTTNRILIRGGDSGWREVVSGFKVLNPVYVVFNVWLGAPKMSIYSYISSEPPGPRPLQPMAPRVRSQTTNLPSATEKSTASTGRLRRADSLPPYGPTNLEPLQSLLESKSRGIDSTGSGPIHPGRMICTRESATFGNFVFRPARLTFSGTPDFDMGSNRPPVDDTRLRKGNFVFIDTPLRPNRVLVVKLTELKRAMPIQIVLTVEKADRVFSCRSLAELCDTSYSLRMESEIPQVGDELAVGISPSGVVHISHNNRGWIQLMHVDTELKYHVVFDMEHITLLSVIGVTNGFREIGENTTSEPSTPPQESRSGVGSDCVVCFENTVNVVIIPCSHVALCEACARYLLGSATPECPVCRTTMADILKVYFA